MHDEHYQSDQMAERDKVLLQSFGIGYDEKRNRVVVVYLRYLADLSAEHQQVWKAHEIASRCTMNSDYQRSSIHGMFPDHYSVYEAFIQEQQEINKLSQMIGKPPLFKSTFEERKRPIDFLPMLRPTLRNFQEFALTLDKMLSDNLNRDFFKGDIPLEDRVPGAAGSEEVRQLGTITLLERWLDAKYRNRDGEAIGSAIVEPLRDVRKARQPRAHSLSQDAYDSSLPNDQDALLAAALRALQKLRAILSSHTSAREYAAPAGLTETRLFSIKTGGNGMAPRSMHRLTELEAAIKADTDLRQRIVRSVGASSVALFALLDDHGKHRLELAGSGSLVVVKSVYYILTAAHVWVQVLKPALKLGITMTDNIAHRSWIDIKAIVPTICKPNGSHWTEWGPDLALLRIPPQYVGGIKAFQLFEDVTTPGKPMNLPCLQFWMLMGTPKELGSFGPHYADVQISGTFVTPRYHRRDSQDYFDIAMDTTAADMPKSFGGVSGGGLWRILAYISPTTRKIDWLQRLKGVAFYEFPTKRRGARPPLPWAKQPFRSDWRNCGVRCEHTSRGLLGGTKG